jgi:hypothetical protein
VTGCEIAELRASFVPPTPIRELRDLTRYRASLAQPPHLGLHKVEMVEQFPQQKSMMCEIEERLGPFQRR